MEYKKPPAKRILKYACTMCKETFSSPKDLQNHRKQVHKAAYNI